MVLRVSRIMKEAYKQIWIKEAYKQTKQIKMFLFRKEGWKDLYLYYLLYPYTPYFIYVVSIVEMKPE